jgi:hypothetical protein
VTVLITFSSASLKGAKTVYFVARFIVRVLATTESNIEQPLQNALALVFVV